MFLPTPGLEGREEIQKCSRNRFGLDLIVARRVVPLQFRKSLSGPRFLFVLASWCSTSVKARSDSACPNFFLRLEDLPFETAVLWFSDARCEKKPIQAQWRSDSGEGFAELKDSRRLPRGNLHFKRIL